MYEVADNDVVNIVARVGSGIPTLKNPTTAKTQTTRRNCCGLETIGVTVRITTGAAIERHISDAFDSIVAVAKLTRDNYYKFN